MHNCPIDHPALPALFDPAVPNNPVLWAVFNGRHAGRVVVDDLQRPSQCVVRTDAVLTFCSRRISQPFLDEAIAYFRERGDVWLVWPPAQSTQLVTPETDSVVERLAFFDCDAQSPVLTELRKCLPDGFEICLIDRQLLERCLWRSEMAFYCGSEDNFLVNGIGLCMMQGDKIIAEAYASALGETRAEIGAITRKAHRGRGYAPITCAYLIQVCEQRGFEAYWSCDVDNMASIRVAQKLGFRQQSAYHIFEF